MYLSLANAVLFVHAAFIAFVVMTVPCLYIGKARQWRWVRSFRLRVLHLAGIGIVVAQAWFGMICPLTILEMWLREKAGLATYSGSFIEHWLQALVYWDLPTWVFILVYSAFALLVLLSWYVVPPDNATSRTEAGHTPRS